MQHCPDITWNEAVTQTTAIGNWFIKISLWKGYLTLNWYDYLFINELILTKNWTKKSWIIQIREKGDGRQLERPSSCNNNINVKGNVKVLQWYSEWNDHRLLIEKKKPSAWFGFIWFDWIQSPLDMRLRIICNSKNKTFPIKAAKKHIYVEEMWQEQKVFKKKNNKFLVWFQVIFIQQEY